MTCHAALTERRTPRWRAMLAGAALAATSLTTIVAAPAARATDTSGFSPTIYTRKAFMMWPDERLFFGEYCGADETPIAAGVSPDSGLEVADFQDHVDSFGDGAYTAWVENRTSNSGWVTSHVRCVDKTRLTATSRVVATFAEDNSTHHTGGYTSCPSGSYALSARVDWNNVNDQQSIDYSGPTWDMRGWRVAGTNAGTGNYMIVDVQCLSSASLPGAFLVHTQQENTSSSPSTITLTTACPAGMAAVNGGSLIQDNGNYWDFSRYVGMVFASYPTDTGWAAQGIVPGKTATDDYIMYVTTWCIPNQEPGLALTGPPHYTNNATASFHFTASDPAAAGGYTLSFQCERDGAPLAACTSPWTTTAFTEGRHTATVVVTTSDGRSASRTWDWSHDETAPTASTTAPTAPFTLTAQVPVAWTGSDGKGSGVGSYNVRYQVAVYTDASLGAYQYPASLQGTTRTSARLHSALGATNCYSAQAVDRATNQSPYSAPVCTARPVDDRALTASNGWTAGSDRAYWNGTYQTTTTHSATLTLTGVHLDRVGIVATTCPGCGTIAFLVAGTQIGTIDLAASATHYRVVRALPAFAPTSGVVVIKVISTGKEVDIDGLATSQA